MSMLAIKITDEIGHLLEKIDVPGKKEDRNEYHITIVEFEDDMSLDEFVQCIDPIIKIVDEFDSLIIETGKLHSFPVERGEKVPIVIDVQSNELHKLRNKIADCFDDAGVRYKNYFKYNPHITLAYADKEIDDKKIDTIEFKVNNVVLYGGDKDNTQLHLTFPFDNSEKNSIIKRKVIIFNTLANVK